MAVGFPRADPDTGLYSLAYALCGGWSQESLPRDWGSQTGQGKRPVLGVFISRTGDLWGPCRMGKHPGRVGSWGMCTSGPVLHWLMAASGGLAPGHVWHVWHPNAQGRGKSSGRALRAFGSSQSVQGDGCGPTAVGFCVNTSSDVSSADTSLQQLLVLPPL